MGLTGNRPAFLVAYDYHTIWMNKEALAAFGHYQIHQVSEICRGRASR